MISPIVNISGMRCDKYTQVKSNSEQTKKYLDMLIFGKPKRVYAPKIILKLKKLSLSHTYTCVMW